MFIRIMEYVFMLGFKDNGSTNVNIIIIVCFVFDSPFIRCNQSAFEGSCVVSSHYYFTFLFTNNEKG